MNVTRRLSFISIGVTIVTIVLSFVVFFQSSVYAATGINQAINFQGKVTNSDGTNVTDGTYDFVFKLYDGAASASTNLFTESWTAAALWSSTMSSAPGSSGESLTYSSNTNESTIKVGQILWNTTKGEAVVVVAVNTGTNVITISPTQQAWAGSDTVTNKIYVKDGIFRVALNSLNQDLSGVDFNTDTIFFGVNFNADGEMKPRIQYTASPYALNAKKVGGLTVTDTTGTLTVPSGKTIEFGGAFTTSGTSALTLTTTSTTNVTLPTTGTLATLAGTETFTSKTIGSTGLTFSGATVDIATGTDEHLVIIPNGTGNVGIGTTSPGAKLDIKSGGTNTDVLKFVATDGSRLGRFVETSGGAGWFEVDDSAGSAVALFRTDAGASYIRTGNFGIGITAPGSKLSISGGVGIGSTATSIFTSTAAPDGGLIVEGSVGIGTTLTTGADLTIKSGTTTSSLYFSDGRAYVGYDAGVGAGTAELGSALGKDVAIVAGGTDRLHVQNSTGFIGIGTTSPNNALEILNTSTQLRLSYDASNNSTIGVDSSGYMTFQSAGTAATGRVQIGIGSSGTTTPDYFALDVKSETGDPAGGFEGAMYYNTFDNKFRCYQGSAWADCIGTGGAGPWTDGSGITYLTDVAEDFAVGSSTLVAPMSVDVSANTVRIGTGSTANAVLSMYASDGDTGGLSYTTNDGWAFEGGNVGIGTTNAANVLSVSAGGANDTAALSNTIALIQNAGVARLETRNATTNTAVILTADTSNAEIDSNNEFMYIGAGSSRQIRLQTNGDTILNSLSGLVGIGTTAPSYKLDVLSGNTTGILQLTGNSITTGTALNLTANGLSSGKALNISSTSTALTSGNLMNLDWSPSSSATATGDIFGINIGASGIVGNLFNLKNNGSSIFSVSQTQITNALPTSFTAAGDVSIAYDLIFSNQTASFIKSNAPLYIEAGEIFESNDLTLRTYNFGNIVADITGSGGFSVGSSVTPIAKFHLEGKQTGKSLSIFNETGDQDIFTASASGTTKLTLSRTGNLTFNQASSIVTSTGSLSFTTAGTATSTIQIGTGGAGTTTPDYFALDVKSDTGDPAGGFEGAMYYNTLDNKFRCYQGSAWTDCIGTGGAGPFTDGAGITYLTDVAEDFAVGAATLAAPLSVDVSANTVRIGTGSTANAVLSMYASDGDTGGITYSTSDAWGFTGGNVGIGTTAPNNSLEVVSTTSPQVRFAYDTSNYVTFAVSSAGAVTVDATGASAGLTFSDAVTASSTLNSTGTVTIGSGGNTFTFNPASGPVYAGTARPAKQLKISPEYEGATLTASGSATITGSMTADTTRDADLGWMNYYEWTSTQGSLQDYSVVVKIKLPSDFGGWATSNAVQINFATEVTDTAKNKLDVWMYNMTEDPDKTVTRSLTNASSPATDWEVLTIDDSEIDDNTSPDWDAADETAVIYLKPSSLVDAVNCTAGYDTGCYVRIGDITLNYLGKF
jgi:hypothetical protein